MGGICDQLGIDTYHICFGGSLCGYLAKKLLNLFAIQNDFYWVLVYIIAVTLLWPVCVIFLSLFTGQFAFLKSICPGYGPG